MAMSPRLMRWMITKLGGTFGVLHDRPVRPRRVEEAGHGVGRPLRRDRHDLVAHDELVEVAEVLVDLGVRHTGAPGFSSPICSMMPR